MAARSSRVGCFGGGWDAGWLPGLEFAGVSQPQLGSPPRGGGKKKKNFFTRDTARNCRAKLTSCLGEKQDPAPSRGTRNSSSARAAEGEGRGRRPRAPGPGRPAHPTAGPGARRAAAALGRPLLLAAAPGAERRGYCLDSACRALRPRPRRRLRRPEPEPRGRAGSMAAPSPRRPSGRPSFCPFLPAFAPRPRTLLSFSRRRPSTPLLLLLPWRRRRRRLPHGARGRGWAAARSSSRVRGAAAGAEAASRAAAPHSLGRGEGTGGRETICWFTPQMATARAGPS